MPITAPVIILSDARTMLKNSLHVPVTQAVDPVEALTVAKKKVSEVLADESTLDEMRFFMLALGIHHETTVNSLFQIP